MKVRMHTLSAGPTGVLKEGEIYDLPEEEAEELVNGGYAKHVAIAEVETSSADDDAEEPEAEAEEAEEAAAGIPETATAEPPERAMEPRPRSRSGGTKSWSRK
ncbi:MAG TPA: hypothetical protein VNL15_06125 [Dehalococcoidia bacterium]|nr:hypothetical protein [Dehalococcoidia bacterium]